MALFNLLAMWDRLLADDTGDLHFSIAEFAL
jgi:hypothetical protein